MSDDLCLCACTRTVAGRWCCDRAAVVSAAWLGDWRRPCPDPTPSPPPSTLARNRHWPAEKADAAENVKQSAASVALVFLIYCVLQTRDGLLVRPHPAVWRVLHGIGVLYLLLLSGIVVLHEDDAKRFLQMLVRQVGTREDGVVQHQGDASDCSISLTTLTRQLTSMWFFAHVVGCVTAGG